MHSNGIKAHANGTTEKLMPYSQDAEQAVLGGILIDPDALYEVAEFLQADDFFIGKHATIYAAMQTLAGGGVAIDFVTLSEYLENKGFKDTGYLVDLINAVPTSINTRYYGRIVHSFSLRRKMSRAASQIANLAIDESESIDTIVERAENALFSATQQATTKHVETIQQGMSTLFDLVHERREAGGQMVGLPTGYIDLDRLLDGLAPSDLIVFAGRPGMGKSLFEAGVSLHLAKMGKRVARFNLEMPAVQIWQRLISIETGIPLTRLRRGDLTDEESKIFDEATGRLAELRMWVDDTAGLNVSQLTAKCRRLHAEYGLDLVTVDYLQLMASDDSRYGNRTQEVGQISRGLKRLAKGLNIPVLALAQLSRACEQRGDKRPLLSDLRDSGDIEQDADVVMFLYRDEYYKPDTTERPNIAEVNVAKHRNGPLGDVDLYFTAKTPKLGNLKREPIRY